MKIKAILFFSTLLCLSCNSNHENDKKVNPLINEFNEEIESIENKINKTENLLNQNESLIIDSLSLDEYLKNIDTSEVIISKYE